MTAPRFTEAELAELCRLLTAATQGEWRSGRSDMTSYDADGRGPYKQVYVDDPHGEMHMGNRLPAVVARGEAGLTGQERCVENAQLIAALVNAAPRLIAAARLANEQAERIDKLKCIESAARDWCEHLEKSGARYLDGVPGDLLDVLELYR